MHRLAWIAGGMVIAAALAAEDFDHAQPGITVQNDNGQAYERDLQRFESEGGPPAPTP